MGIGIGVDWKGVSGEWLGLRLGVGFRGEGEERGGGGRRRRKEGVRGVKLSTLNNDTGCRQAIGCYLPGAFLQSHIR